MPDEIAPAPLPARSRELRWWPLIVLILIEAAWLTWVWQGQAAQRQQQVIKTAGGVLAGVVFLLLWLFAFSRAGQRAKVGVLLILGGAVAVFAGLFRVVGITGDLVPIVVPRWRSATFSTVSYISLRGEPQPGSGAAERNIRIPANFAGFPQFLGPTRDGIIPGPALARDWKAQPPELFWRVPAGEAYSGFAIAGERAISFEQLGEKETLICRDLFTGKTLWTHEDATRFENSLGGIGPRTTPTISGERVYALGATGRLRVLELTSGRLLWQRDIMADAATSAPEWGAAGSPLVVKDLVIVHPGGPRHSLAAYRIEDGTPAWAAGNAAASYSSPQLVTLLGAQQILIFDREGVTSHSVDDGKVLWSYPWTKASQHVSDPRIVAPDCFVVSSGYGAGADLVQLSRDSQGGWTTARQWHTQRLKSKFASLVTRDGMIYGLDDGRLTCIDLATGEPRWKGERVGHGQVLLAGDLLVVTAENGEVILLEASPEGPKELSRFTALEGKMWNPPALASPFLIVRTEKEAACYRLPLATKGAQ